MQRVIVSYKPESAVDADLFLRYDYEDPDSPRPSAYSLSAEDIVAVYGTATYGTATYGGADRAISKTISRGFRICLSHLELTTTEQLHHMH